MNTTQIKDPAVRPIDGESAEELIAYALSKHCTITRAQLERRHREGIVPRPKQVARRDGRGTVTIYPAGSKELLVIGCAFEKRYGSLKRAAWEMWFAGHPVPLAPIRKQMETLARWHDRIGAFVARRFGP